MQFFADLFAVHFRLLPQHFILSAMPVLLSDLHLLRPMFLLPARTLLQHFHLYLLPLLLLHLWLSLMRQFYLLAVCC